AVLEIHRPDPSGKLGGQQVHAKPGERGKLARFRENRLQTGVGFQEAADFGGVHGYAFRGGDVQIIVISDRLAKARTLSLSLRHLLASATLALLVLVSMTAVLYWVGLRFAADIKIPLLQQLVLAAQKGESERAREFMQQNLNAMAVKIGEMQAQLTRLDALGERLSALAGFRPQEFRFSETPGMGGAVSTLPPQNLSMAEFNERVTSLPRPMASPTHT